MDMTNTAIASLETFAAAHSGLIAERNGHKRFYPAAATAVTSMWGRGQLVSVTDDGWAEVQLDGETRRDEYPAEHVFLA
jgi:hypothetical protein